MARMMDSLILDSLSTTPFAYTKITTHRPVKKATSTTNLPAHGPSAATAAAAAATMTNGRTSFHTNNKKIPTQGECGAGIVYHNCPIYRPLASRPSHTFAARFQNMKHDVQAS